jgi:hypothetical protein
MSDPANYGIIQYASEKNEDGTSKKTGIMWIFMNWGGEGMANRLAKALDEARARWDDQPYANAQIIACIGRAGDLSGVTWNQLDDNDHSLYVVDFVQNKVALYDKLWTGNLEDPAKSKMGWDLPKFIEKYKKD